MKIANHTKLAPNKTLVCVNPSNLALTKGKAYRGYELLALTKGNAYRGYELGEYYMYIEDDRGCIISVAYKWSDEQIFVSLDEHRQLRIEELGI
jgi:hypothetical protein